MTVNGKTKGVSIVFWNLRSIVNKLDNFKTTIENLGHKIYCITETWLKSNIHDSLLHKDGYNLFRLDRKTLNKKGFIKRGGGILIYTDISINVKAMDNADCISCDPDAEIYTLCINLPHTRPIYIITLYRPPEGDVVECIRKLQTICDSLPKRHLCDIIIGGDFNIDYAKSSNEKTKLLKTFMKKNTLIQIIGESTRPLYNTAMIDLILTNTNKAKSSGTIELNLSDHLPTFINLKKDKTSFKKSVFKGRSYKNFNEDEFLRLLQAKNIELVCQNRDVRVAWSNIRRIIEETLDVMAPIREFKFGNTKPGWLSNDLMEMMKDRNRALKKATKTKLDKDKKYARTIRNLVNQYIKNARSDFIQEQLTNLKDKPKKFWNILNDIIDPSRNTKSFKLTNSKGEELSDTVAAETINDFFAQIGKNLSEKIKAQPHRNWVYLPDLRAPVFELPKMNREILAKFTKNIKTYKSSGMSTVSSKVWKLFYDNFDHIMVHLYNLVLTSMEYPQDWKIATVVPIPKIANATKPGELRPISLLPLPGKILEHHIHDNIQEYLDRENLLTKFQNGFRKDHSTQQTVFKYTTDLLENNNNNLTSIATYIDFKKAFDTVNHKLLIGKLEKYGLGPNTLRLLTSYLDERKQFTVINGTKSSIKSVLFGVPQGSVVGPQLFSIYINDIVNQVVVSKIQMYADDIVLYTDIENNFDAYQQDMERVVDWCIGNELTMNIDKTKFQIFPTNRRIDVEHIANTHVIQIGTDTLKHVRLYKYLGVEIDNLLSMKQHAKNILKVGAHKLFMLRHIRKVLTMHASILIFKSVFIGVLDYGSIFVSSIPEEMKEDIQILQNNALRCCLNILDPRDANVLEMHRQVNVQLYKHRMITNLLLCIRNAVLDSTLKIKTCDILTRGNDGQTILLPIPRTRNMRKMPFYWGAQIWNTLPLHIRQLEEKTPFKNFIKNAVINNNIRLHFDQ